MQFMKDFITRIWGYVEDGIFGNEKTFSDEEISTLPKVLNDHSYIFSIFCYRNSKIKKIIQKIKYKGNRQLIKAISIILYDYILEDITEKKLLYNFQKPLIIPIPATQRRLKEHGYNQCERLVRALESIDKQTSFEAAYDLLKKIKETGSQAHTKGREIRLGNLKDSFGMNNPEKIKNQNIILIDDVWTTGATISEARKELLRIGAKSVTAYTIAH